MSFWKSLFGGAKTAGSDKPAREIEHKGYTIAAMPFIEGGQYQVAGRITKDIGGELKEHRFVRADRFASHEDATEISLLKGRQMVDQQGDSIFS